MERNGDVKRPGRRPSRPAGTWPLPQHGRRVYVTFVSKAVLWDKNLCHRTTHVWPENLPVLCPRFLSHMKVRPGQFGPVRSLTSGSGPSGPLGASGPSGPSVVRPPPTRHCSTQNTHLSTVTIKTQTLEGCFNISADRRRGVPNGVSKAGRRLPVVVPCHPLPVSPASPAVSAPFCQNAPRFDSERHGRQLSGVRVSPAGRLSPLIPPEEQKQRKEEKAKGPEMEPGGTPPLLGSACSERAGSAATQGSLSDWSRPASSLFSRSTDLNSGRSSAVSDITDMEPDGSVCLSSLRPSPVSRPSTPAGRCSGPPAPTAAPPNATPRHLGPPKPATPPLASDSPKPTSGISTPAENQAGSVPPGAALAFASSTWSSCPSPQRTARRLGSGAKPSPSPGPGPGLAPRWPVLPPVSPVRADLGSSHSAVAGRSGSALSGLSDLSCSRSRVFDELEAIAPRSASPLSLDPASESSGRPSPHIDLSPGLAALTVGCHSGDLGSLSRVQLLLLDRQQPDPLHSPSGLMEDLYPEDNWPEPLPDLSVTSAGDLGPLTAGSICERWDSVGEIQENRADGSEGASGSPTSWIIDAAPPSPGTLRSPSPSRSAAESGQGPSAAEEEEEEEEEEEANYPGWKEEGESFSGGRRRRSEDRGTEESNTKLLGLLSKLQDESPPPPSDANKGCSNFEDFDFLAKYCIFSQEKLAEHKRAFEVADTDADGYISCLQVFLALKTIIPPELLSEEEEIYVYRILEMVDFRVTDGLVDLRLFAVIASLAQKIATMDDFMRSLISSMDFRSLEVRLFKAKQLFLFLLEEQQHGEEEGARLGFISAEQLLLELKAGGIQPQREAAIRRELQRIPPMDLLDFLAYLPLFMLIHRSVVSNPLDDASSL